MPTVGAEGIQVIKRLIEENDKLKRNLLEADRALDIIRTTPKERLVQVVQDLRLTENVSTFLADSRSKCLDHERRFSKHRLSRCYLPPTHSSLEFELMMRHPVAYPTLVPVEAAHVDLEKLLSIGRSNSSPGPDGKLDLKLCGPADVLNLSLGQDEAESAIGDRLDLRSGASTTLTEPDSPVVGPAPIPSYCDERLHRLEISNWTSITINNDFAARVISLYLETDHPILGLFDADLFLDNLISGKLHFCSPLLVSALLCWACEAYCYFEPEADILSLLFYDEAKLLWQREIKVPTLTAVSASQLLSIAATCHGNDTDAILFLKQGTTMGKTLGLFGVPEAGSAKQWLGDHIDWIQAASHTAWGVFSWVTFRCLHFHVGQIETPPFLPIPGDERSEDESHDRATDFVNTGNQPSRPGKGPGSGPELALGSEAPEPFHRLPPYMGRTFTVMCGLWSIAHDIIWAYYDSEDHVAPASRAHLDKAEVSFQKLLRWADKLPMDLVRGDQLSHHTTLAHIYYHALIIDLFRPFVQGPHKNAELKSFSSPSSTPRAVYTSSVNQLKRLVLVYRVRFPSASYTFLWHTALLYVANAMLGAHHVGRDPDARAWLRLCLSGYKKLFGSFRVVENIVLGLLSMALRDGIISLPEARDVLTQLRSRATAARKRPANSSAKATFMVDLNLSMVDPLAAKVDRVAKIFDQLSLPEGGV